MNRTVYLLFMIGTILLFAYLAHMLRYDGGLFRDFVALAVCETGFFVFADITRAKNAGKPWWLGLLGVIPIVSLAIFIYLLIVPPAKPNAWVL
jgi:hypothetical protein